MDYFIALFGIFLKEGEISARRDGSCFCRSAGALIIRVDVIRRDVNAVVMRLRAEQDAQGIFVTSYCLHSSGVISQVLSTVIFILFAMDPILSFCLILSL